MAIHVLGIRHHGPGSARNVKSFLEQIKPDIVLVEGPPEADDILQWVTNKELKPPVAILAYQPENPNRSVFYPFADFSPEWQAISYAKQHNIHVRFMDLPVTHQFAIENEKQKDAEVPSSLNSSSEIIDGDAASVIISDPMTWLAQAAGYDDGEKWWEHMFEYRHDNQEVFEAVTEAMTELREAFPAKDDRMEKLREAYMRKTIRQAEKEMFQTIAVICGAWHAPVLINMPKQKEDNDLLKGLAKARVECTWVPWTYNRLSFFSGYGAGIVSPGWYEHTWKHPKDNGTRWITKVAKLLRKKQMDTSVAHVIEAVRLAESLASLRALSKAGLEELNEATLTVLCNGESILMSLIQDELIVSNKIGEVPTEIPKPPLQLDIEKWQKKLRLPPTADFKDYILDLRKENDLERSIFLHRLLLLELKWGNKYEVGGKGTFKEQWRLQWDPAFSIDIIEKGKWGNLVEEAASKYISEKAVKATALAEVCVLLEQTMPAELHEAIESLITRINNLAAATGDVIQLMEVIPNLVTVNRYGNVRKTDAELVMTIIGSMIVRICVSLPSACTAVQEEAAQHLLELFFKLNDAINVLQEKELTERWERTLLVIAYGKNTSPVIAGYTARLLNDHKILLNDELMKVFHYAMSSATPPAVAASWLEGFLKGSGTILLIDHNLWSVIDGWVSDLDNAVFIEILPLLRRTFSNFTNAERRKLGEKVKHGNAGTITRQGMMDDAFDVERAKSGIPIVMELLGYKKNDQSGQ